MFLNEYEEYFLKNTNGLVNDEANGLMYIIHNDNRKTELNVYIPGIGMNHKVFLFAFNNLSKDINKQNQNCLLAITLSGFNQYCQNNSTQVRTLPFSEHEQVDNAVRIIEEFKSIKNYSKVNLFGFSYGADLLCDIAQGLIKKDITVKKMVFSDINLNEQTAFLTQKINTIECNSPKNYSTKKKKILFFIEILNSKNSDEKILDNFEYSRASYKVSWDQMIKSAETAFQKSTNRVDNVKVFLIKHKSIECIFFISKEKIGDDPDGYLNQIREKMISDEISQHRISYKSTKKHFDGISNATINKANNFFKKNNQFI